MHVMETSLVTATQLEECFEQQRSALTGYCYRMLGSPFDADDAVQESFVRAWRGVERFEGRSALSSWLYRIATNVCIDMAAARGGRGRPMGARRAGGALVGTPHAP